MRDELTIGEAEAREAGFFEGKREGFEAGWRAAIEAAAAQMECGCARAADVVAEVAANGGNSSLRWALCPDARCDALNAAVIRALPVPEGGQ